MLIRWIIIGSIIGWFWFIPNIGFAEGNGKEIEWENWTKQIEQKIQAGDYLEAKSLVTKLAISFSQTNFQTKKYSVPIIHALSDSILEIDQELNQVSSEPERLAQSAKKLRFAFDAITHSNQPLWRSYDQELIQSLNHVKEANTNKNTDQLQKSVQELMDKYNIVQPALIIGKNPAAIQKLTSLLAFLTKSQDFEQNKTVIEVLEQFLPTIFHGTDQDVMQFLYPTKTLSVGSVAIWLMCTICMVLSYFLWKKYEGTRTKGW